VRNLPRETSCHRCKTDAKGDASRSLFFQVQDRKFGFYSASVFRRQKREKKIIVLSLFVVSNTPIDSVAFQRRLRPLAELPVLAGQLAIAGGARDPYQEDQDRHQDIDDREHDGARHVDLPSHPGIPRRANVFVELPLDGLPSSSARGGRQKVVSYESGGR